MMAPRSAHIPHNVERTALQKVSPTRGLTAVQLFPAGSQTIAGMAAKGWIEKQPDGQTYCITPAGVSALRAAIPVKR
jgi:predicted transcriptional regulator